jgi:hypothetical protein
LKQGHDLLASVVAVLSFVWLAWTIENAKKEEPNVELRKSQREALLRLNLGRRAGTGYVPRKRP